MNQRTASPKCNCHWKGYMGSHTDECAITQAQLPSKTNLYLVPVEPQPTYIESSGRWKWPLPKRAQFPGCCTDVVTASREWWEYAPSEAKPHPMAEGVQLRDAWYWAIPLSPSPSLHDVGCNLYVPPDETSARHCKHRMVDDGRGGLRCSFCGSQAGTL